MADPEKAMLVDDSHEEMEDEEEEGGAGADLSAADKQKILMNPALLSALQGKLDSMAGSLSGYIQSLPPPVKRRLKALKKIQLETTKIEAKFYEEVHKLECKYHQLYTPLYEKRAQITKGDYEPKDDECDWPSDDEESELADDVKDKVKVEDDKEKKEEVPAKGVPEFWLTILKNIEITQDMIQEHDEPALEALRDVKVTFSDGQADAPMGFKLHFMFGPNDYFTDAELTKEYEMKCVPSEQDPFSFDGPEIFRCKGCPIHWKPNKKPDSQDSQEEAKAQVKRQRPNHHKASQERQFLQLFRSSGTSRRSRGRG